MIRDTLAKLSNDRPADGHGPALAEVLKVDAAVRAPARRRVARIWESCFTSGLADIARPDSRRGYL